MKNVARYIDIAFCLVVLPVMVITFPIERWFHNFPCYVISVAVWLYGLYFLNRKLTIPFLFRDRKRILVAIGLFLASIAVTYGFSMIHLYTPKPSIFDIGITRVLPKVNQYQQAVWCLFMIVEAYSFAVGLLVQTYMQRTRLLSVKAYRDKAELELYRAQIKPHFMFNTLNSLYGLFLTNNEKALESLERFISMMRYLHTSSKTDTAPLADEIDYIRQYVALQSLRLNEKTTVELHIDTSGDDLRVPPMLFVTFVENCFKHGVSPDEESRISISIVQKGEKLNFTTSNKIFPIQRISENMGIENCRKRLALLYPGHHNLEIGADGSTYSVKLQIDCHHD